MFQHTRQHFEQLLDRRTRVRYLSIGFERLLQSADQISLFTQEINPQESRHDALHLAMDKLRDRHGYSVVSFGYTHALGIA